MHDLRGDLAERRVIGVHSTRAPWLGVDAVTVRCAPGQRPLAPLLQARRRLHELAGVPPWEPHRLRASLTRRLLGDADQWSVHDLVADLDHAASECPNTVVAIEGAEHIDPETIAVLRRARREPGWLHVPFLLAFDALPRGGVQAEFARELGVVERSPGPLAPPPPDVTLVLRAAAHLGATFTVDEVASLLGWSDTQVLLALQQAADLGEPLTDDGNGTLSWTASRVAELRERVLPSLRARWAAATETPPTPVSAPFVSPVPAATAPQRARSMAAAARHALDGGHAEQAKQLAQRALDVISDVGGDDDDVHVLRLGLLLEVAQAHWRAIGEGSTLEDALAAVDAAWAQVKPDDPAELVATILSTGAGIRYEVGVPGLLSDALDQLVEATRRLRSADKPLLAASLLNDQAAVWIRLGDPVRAAHLLRTSRDIFTGATEGPDGAIATAELAQTEHLLARLPLHVASRPGFESDAIDAALDSAVTAARLYRDLPDPRSLGRVLETQGRLLARAGHLDHALARLRDAAGLQQELHDALGLARTAGALAEVLAARGQEAHAVRLLGDSVRLNLEVGTPLGLAYNRQGMEQLARVVTNSDAVLDLRDVRTLLLQAEELLGRTPLPPSVRSAGEPAHPGGQLRPDPGHGQGTAQ